MFSWLIILVVLIIALIQSVSPGISFMLFWYAITILLLWSFVRKEDKKFLTLIFTIGVIIRVLVAIYLHMSSIIEGWEGVTSGDEGLYWRKGKLIAAHGLASIDHSITTTDPFSPYGVNAYTIIGAIFYATFGSNLMAFKFFNVFFGSFIPILIYYISIYLFKGLPLNGKNIAKVSSIMIMAAPSLINWSAVGLKDNLIVFFIIIIFLTIVKSSLKISWYYSSIIFVSILFLVNLQKDVAYIILGVVLLSYFVKSHVSKKKVIIGIVGLIVILVIFYNHRSEALHKIGIELYKIASHQMAQASADDAGYILFPWLSPQNPDYYPVFYRHIIPPNDRFDNFMFPQDVKDSKIIWSAFFISYINGFVYAFFSPFPWAIKSSNQLLAYPQMIIWYTLLPVFLVGVIYSLKYKLKEVYPIVLFMFIIGSVFALSEGNIGGVFRHRDWITSFYLMFGGVGLVKIFRISSAGLR